MKNIIYILILLLSSSILAQDPQLFEDTWYLQKLTINGVENFPPNVESPPLTQETTFSESNNGFSTSYCDFYVTQLIYNDPESSFDASSIVQFGGTCTFIVSLDFNLLYYNFFEDGVIYNPFNYEITNNNGIRYLELTNANGDNALYANELLNTAEMNIINASVYPNPASSEIKVRFEGLENEATIRVIDITGKEVHRITSTTIETTIQIASLKAGVYFLGIETKDGMTAVYQFIKE